MPFYGGGVQSGNMVDGSGFAPPIREHRFPNAVWHQTPGADPNAIGKFVLIRSYLHRTCCRKLRFFC